MKSQKSSDWRGQLKVLQFKISLTLKWDNVTLAFVSSVGKSPGMEIPWPLCSLLQHSPFFWWKMLSLGLNGCFPGATCFSYLLSLYVLSLRISWLFFLENCPQNQNTVRDSVSLGTWGALHVSSRERIQPVKAHPIIHSEKPGQSGGNSGQTLGQVCCSQAQCGEPGSGKAHDYWVM